MAELTPHLPDWLAGAELPDWLAGELPEPAAPPSDLAEPALPEPIFPDPPPPEPLLPAIDAPVEVSREPEPLKPELSATNSHLPRARIDGTLQEVWSVPRISTRQRVPVKSMGPGRPTIYGVQVRNPRSRSIHDIVVEHDLPLGLRFLGADPMPRRRGRRLIWTIASLAPHAEQAIRLRVAPTRGLPPSEVPLPEFEISYVQDSALVLTATGPTQMRLGEQAVLRLRILNTSDRLIADALLRCQLHSTVPGSRVEVLESRLAHLAPGQTRTVHLNTQVRKPAMLQCLAQAVAEGWPEAAVQLAIRVDFGAALDESVRERAAAEMELAVRSQRHLADGDKPGERHLVFSLADGDCAIPASQVLQVDRPPEPTPVPNVPDWVLGVANVRGDLISLVDLRGFLGLPPVEPGGRARVVVVRSRDEEMTAGLVVDGVSGMRVLQTRPDAGEQLEFLAPYGRGAAECDGRPLTVLDLDRLLLSPAMRQFETT